ncbi:uncharacterized protein METZ01_LOCUS390874, partial [marine metagenome]
CFKEKVFFAPAMKGTRYDNIMVWRDPVTFLNNFS